MKYYVLAIMSLVLATGLTAQYDGLSEEQQEELYNAEQARIMKMKMQDVDLGSTPVSVFTAEVKGADDKDFKKAYMNSLISYGNKASQVKKTGGGLICKDCRVPGVDEISDIRIQFDDTDHGAQAFLAFQTDEGFVDGRSDEKLQRAANLTLSMPAAQVQVDAREEKVEDTEDSVADINNDLRKLEREQQKTAKKIEELKKEKKESETALATERAMLEAARKNLSNIADEQDSIR